MSRNLLGLESSQSRDRSGAGAVPRRRVTSPAESSLPRGFEDDIAPKSAPARQTGLLRAGDGRTDFSGLPPVASARATKIVWRVSERAIPSASHEGDSAMTQTITQPDNRKIEAYLVSEHARMGTLPRH